VAERTAAPHRLRACHDYLYRERDPEGEGLAAMRHPWESGQDDSPAWDGALAAIPLDPSAVAPYRRVDLTLVHADERPDPADYDHYVALIECFKRHRYDEAAMRKGCPFWVAGPLFNSALARAGEDLAAIAEALGEDAAPLRAQAARTTEALNRQLWERRLGHYVAYDRRQRRYLRPAVSASFAPLLTAAPGRARVSRMLRTLTSTRFWPPPPRGPGLTSYDRRAPGFSHRQYWRGPVWVNVNWLAIDGLRRHRRDDVARTLARQTLDLVRERGFWSTTIPRRGKGWGPRSSRGPRPWSSISSPRTKSCNPTPQVGYHFQRLRPRPAHLRGSSCVMGALTRLARRGEGRLRKRRFTRRPTRFAGARNPCRHGQFAG
jgi:Trehalase